MNDEQLSPRERQIMDVLFSLGEASAKEIQERLSDELANATIRTMLRILETKGHLVHRKANRSFIYRPVAKRDAAAKSAMKRLVKVFFEGSITQAVSGLLELKDTQLSQAEVDELTRLITEAQTKQKS